MDRLSPFEDRNISEMILLELDIESIPSACRTNKRLAAICREERFWRKVIARNFPGVVKPSDVTYREYFDRLRKIIKLAGKKDYYNSGVVFLDKIATKIANDPKSQKTFKNADKLIARAVTSDERRFHQLASKETDLWTFFVGLICKMVESIEEVDIFATISENLVLVELYGEIIEILPYGDIPTETTSPVISRLDLKHVDTDSWIMLDHLMQLVTIHNPTKTLNIILSKNPKTVEDYIKAIYHNPELDAYFLKDDPREELIDADPTLTPRDIVYELSDLLANSHSPLKIPRSLI